MACFAVLNMPSNRAKDAFLWCYICPLENGCVVGVKIGGYERFCVMSVMAVVCFMQKLFTIVLNTENKTLTLHAKVSKRYS